MLNKKFLITYKLFFATLGLYAIAQETIVAIDRGTYNFINFWSYFTNQSNLFAAITLIVTAYLLIKGVKPHKNWPLFRGAATLYMIITGVVFAVLLSGGDPKTFTAVPIDNTILHQLLPIIMALDWIIDPPMKRIGFKRALVWIAFPLIYAICALIRGVLTGFYPYPFFNPANGGYGRIFVTVIGITLFVLAIAFVMTRLPIKSVARR